MIKWRPIVPQHPYGQLQEHLDRLRSALQSTKLPAETIDALQDRIEKIERVARPNEVSYCGAPEHERDKAIALGDADPSDDFTPMLRGIAERVLPAILDEAIRDLNVALRASDLQEACSISYCLGRLEGALGEFSAKEVAEELAERAYANRSKGGKCSAKLKTERDFALLRQLFKKHDPTKRSKADLCRKIAGGLREVGIQITPDAVENNLVREGLIPPPVPRSKGNA